MNMMFKYFVSLLIFIVHTGFCNDCESARIYLVNNSWRVEVPKKTHSMIIGRDGVQQCVRMTPQHYVTDEDFNVALPTLHAWTKFTYASIALMSALAAGGLCPILSKITEKFALNSPLHAYVYGGAGLCASLFSLWGYYRMRAANTTVQQDSDVQMLIRKQKVALGVMVALANGNKEKLSSTESDDHIVYTVPFESESNLPELRYKPTNDYIKSNLHLVERIRIAQESSKRGMISGAAIAVPFLGAAVYVAYKHGAKAATTSLLLK